jgi:GAF domain-containing protein
MMRARLKRLFVVFARTDKDPAAGSDLPYTIRYALIGAGFGLLFPTLALGILLATSVSLSWPGLLERLLAEPLFWIIAPAPLFLGLFGAITGWREDQLRQTSADLKQEREEAVQLEVKAAALERRAAQLKAAIEISRRLSNSLDWDELVAELVHQVKDKFDYNHAQIYLMDEERKELVGATGTGRFGPQLEARGYTMPVDDPTSLVARAVRTGDVVSLSSSQGAADGLPHPRPVDTYSKLAVPIILDRQVLGVLEVHESQVAGGLTDADANLLSSLVTQLAVAMRNARLFRQVESNLVEVRELQQRYIRRSWDRSLLTRHGKGRVKFSLGESTTLSEATITEARRLALKQTGPALVALDQPHQPAAPDSQNVDPTTGDDRAQAEAVAPAPYSLVAPIVLRNVTIGNLQLHEIDPERQWTEGELTFISAIIDQLAQSAENLRLIDEATERASREQLISQISDRLRRAVDVETLMKIGVEELSRILRPARTYVQFGSEEELGLAYQNAAASPAGDGPAPAEQLSTSNYPAGSSGADSENEQGDRQDE